MKKLILCASLVAAGMMVSCEKELLVPEGAENKPEWLGGSIYEELRSGAHLTGTFNTYLRLIDDLGYNEILSRTGSKTIFPANDEAFDRFFKKNQYGVTSYDQLTEGMKAQILKSSMIDNAMLAGMLSNVKVDDNNVKRGQAIKHATNVSLSDSITYYATGDQMPQNNTYWDEYRRKGIHVVSDNTVPMMVHFTREQMLGNAITTTGVDSDFGILRGELKGSSISNSDTAYIFQTRIVNQDVTCTNGYIHQIGDVLVPPGNVPQVMRSEANTKLFSRILDYHCAPYYDEKTTNNYNAWAMQSGRPTIDSIYQIRYFSTKSQGNGSNILDPTGAQIATDKRLDWDLGWNQYYSSTNAANSLNDMGAILAPTDQAIENYFLPGGGGAYFIDLYSQLPNTKENLPQNLDSLFNNGNGILTTFVNNLIQTSFVATVPSKFGTITNEGSGDFMGLTRDNIHLTEDGRYDVVVANNGVVYKMSEMIAPDLYQSVIGPAVTYPDMTVMSYFSQDKTSGATSSIFGADMYYYLMAMKANYLYFIPDDEALKGCFIDPVSLGKEGQQRALEFYSWLETSAQTGRVDTRYGVKIHKYDPETGIISPEPESVVTNIVSSGSSAYASQVYDMLNYNTVVLDAGEEITNHYYLTKHGGAIRIDNFRDDGGNFTGTVSGGAQIDNYLTPANIEQGWREKNGWAFRLDNVIQPSITSVNKLLTNNSDRFQLFLNLCGIFDDTNLTEWADISGSKPANGGVAPIERYIVFSGKEKKALDMNVNFFNGYNYTFYAPDNTAMEKAHNEMGLPRYEDLLAIYNRYAANDEAEPSEVAAAKQRVKEQLNIIRAFIRYHFQNNSVFADNYVKETTYQSMYSSELGIPVNITTKSTDGVLTVTDARGAGHEIVIDANDGSRLANKMTRDMEYDKERENATAIAVSSFAVVHQISEPLCFNKKTYDGDNPKFQDYRGKYYYIIGEKEWNKEQ